MTPLAHAVSTQEKGEIGLPRIIPINVLFFYGFGAVLVSRVVIKSCQIKDGHSLGEWSLSSTTAHLGVWKAGAQKIQRKITF